MRGFVTSPRAAKIYDFLHRVGPAPFPALLVALGCRHGQLAKALRHLRGAGYASPVRLRGVEFWGLDGALPPEGQEALAWFAARLEEAGGRFEGGLAKFPRGQELPVRAKGDQVDVGEYVFLLQDLQEKPLRECFRKNATARGAGGVQKG